MTKPPANPAQTSRFSIRSQPNSEWTIYDVFTGSAAKPSNWPMIDLPLDKAREYCGILNAMDRLRRSCLR